MEITASVIVRSYNRLPALLELIDALRVQNYRNFEIIIVEQSTDYNDEDWNKLEAVTATDQRIKLLKYKPLGGPKARNEGVKNASGEILIFIDDDDLPASDEWIKGHIEAYQDPKLVGFTGRHIFEGNDGYPYLKWMTPIIRNTCMSYSFFKFPYTFAQFNEDVENVEWLHGTNSSIRKEWALKAGLWDVNVTNQDEHSFAFKLNKILTEDLRLDFRSKPELIRRMDIEGGMGKRSFSMKREWKNQYNYCTKIIYRYYPAYKFFFPVHLLLILMKVVKNKLANL
ncbi:MAG: glycosyltransferase family 2 protein [Balneola sp.]|nr:glycosyltransferase family 2 protein [Balneola sp.]MBO6651553.1 glycosyltransferase family 2 protein [Balneola sp.]MBO6710906.1 glycosyltransferase family 2 protein [Balneola sp.]MBO6799594.1 glycosyltransferase family 2 protein [Balneola sp.]MBO6870326.1 glycosyltransferase family 2 protein [Balneola sp.]